MIDLNKLWQTRKIMPVITIDYLTGKVLLYGYMNKEAFAYTLKTHRAWYYNPADETIKMKGEHSGDVQKIMSVKTDYDCKALLISVEQIGHVSHREGCHKTYFIHDIYNRDNPDIKKRKKFEKVDIDENFDYSKSDYDDEFEEE